MRNIITMAASMLVLTALTVPVMANSSVTVKLWDNGQTVDLSKNMGMVPGSKMDMSKAPMGIKIQPAMVPAGKVIFKVTNLSKAVIHEMLLAPLEAAYQRSGALSWKRRQRQRLGPFRAAAVPSREQYSPNSSKERRLAQ